jgi:hypothetical protein
MILGGLWHGASWRFVIWGIWHGIGLVFDKLLKPVSSRLPRWITSWIGFFITFHFVVAGWILFRANDMNKVIAMTKRIFSAFHPDLIIPAIQSNVLSYGLIFTGLLIHWFPASLKERFRGWFINIHWTAKVALIAITVVFMLQFSTAEVVPFIYFRF